MTKVDCYEDNKRLVPLIKAVKAAIIDTGLDYNSNQQMYTHWVGRAFKMLNTEVLKMGGRKVMLNINPNTKTATLPIDFEFETFIGVIDNRGIKVPLKLNNDLADGCNYDEIAFEDKCTSCGQDKNICTDLAVTEEIKLVVIDGNTYEDSVVKKLYPNGDYYLVTTKNIKNLSDESVTPFVSKEYITTLGLKPCGCLETTTDNIANIKTNCYDTYCNYYSSCENTCAKGGYKILEETGLIQFDFGINYTKIALDYVGFLPKKNGRYMIPEIAFETVVENAKWRAIKDKKSSDRWRIFNAWNDYVTARKSMHKMLTRVSLSDIINSFKKAPKFEIDYGETWYGCFSSNTNTAVTSISTPIATSSNTTTTVIINNASYQLAVKTGNGIGHPVEGLSTYQNNLLKGATDVNFILLAKQTLTKGDGDFTFDSVTGTIDISPSTFYTPDTLIIPYNKTT